MLDVILTLAAAFMLFSISVVILCFAVVIAGFEVELHDWISSWLDRRKGGKHG